MNKKRIFRKNQTNPELPGQEVFLYDDHPKPMTRRSFLAHGLIDSTVLISVPTIFQMLSRPAIAAPSQPTDIFFVFDSSGGAAVQGQYLALPMTPTGDLPADTALTKIGLQTSIRSTASATSKIFGIPMLASNPLLTTITGNLAAADLAKMTSGANVHVVLQDDTRANMIAIGGNLNAYLNLKMGKQFHFIGNGLAVPNGGLVIGESGSNSTSIGIASKSSGWLPITTNNTPNSVASAISSPFGSLSSAQGVTVERAVAALAFRRQQVANEASSINEKIQLGHAQNATSMASASSLVTDPNATGGLSTAVKNILLKSGDQGEAQKFGQALLAGLSGISLPLVVTTLGGGDHHNGTTTSPQQFGLRLGVMVAAAVQACKEIGANAHIAFISDGGMNTATPDQWSSDEGRYGKLHTLHYFNAGKPALSKFQLGAADPTSGFARQDNLVGGNPRVAGAALLLNLIAGAEGSSDVAIDYGKKVLSPVVLQSLSTDALLKSLISLKV